MELAQRDHSALDCCVVVILSHGCQVGGLSSLGRCLGKAVWEPHSSRVWDTLSFMGRAMGPVYLLLFSWVPSGPLRIWMLPLGWRGGGFLEEASGRGREQINSAHRASAPGFCSELAQPIRTPSSCLRPDGHGAGPCCWLAVRTLASTLGSAMNVPNHCGQAPSPSWSLVSSSFKLRVGQIKDYKLGAWVIQCLKKWQRSQKNQGFQLFLKTTKVRPYQASILTGFAVWPVDR